MQLSARTISAENYRFGFNGMEADDEMKSAGNSYDFGARMLDPRLGRFFAVDPLMVKFPHQSSYTFASNTPIRAKDFDGKFTIFVNGYIYGSYPGPFDDIQSGAPYWKQSKRDSDEFVNAAHSYFQDGLGIYLNGSGETMLSTASSRRDFGLTVGKLMAADIAKQIKEINEKAMSAGTEQITEINFVTHSMGAAYAEGMIEAFMENDELAALLKNGTIIHFSAADGNNIEISSNSESLNRTQINYLGDQTLRYADSGALETGGYQIPGVEQFGVVLPKIEDLHPSVSEADRKGYDWHFDTKAYKEVWNAVKVLDTKLTNDPNKKGSPVYIQSSEISK